MHIFSQEIKDGIAELIATSNSLAFELIPSIIEKTDISKADTKMPDLDTVSSNTDLLYFNSILASVGWNKNDDVFDAKELWRARSTPVNKKINFMHDEKDIIGHMTNSNVIDFSGRFIPENVQDTDVPDGFDVVVGGFLYKFWQSSELRERMQNIVDMVNSQKIAVSMECIFPSFDYAVISPDGQNRIIRRDDDTAFLTKHLRIYGGSGSYEGFKVGRLLRNMVFTGNALVDRPANPRSLILKKDALSFSGSIASINILTKMEKDMPDNVVSQEKYDALLKLYESAEAASKEVADKELKVTKEQNEKFSNEIKRLEGELSVSKELAKSHEDNSTKLSDKIKELESALAKAKEEMDNYKKDMCKSKRKASMASIDVDDARANELIEKFTDVSDEIFDEFIKAMPKKVVKTDTIVTPTASAKEILDKASDKDVTVVVTSDIEKTLIASASEWFLSNSKSNKDNKGE